MARVMRLVAILWLCAWSVARAQAPTGKVLDIQGRVLDIVGVARDVGGMLKDLGAKINDTEIVIELAADVLFDFDKYDLKPAAIDALTRVAEALKGLGDAPATVEGHTDGKGASEYNLQLSERRANSVKEWLVKQGGVPAGRLSSKGFGMTRPVASNTKPDGSDNPDGRQKNRRVEIRISKK